MAPFIYVYVCIYLFAVHLFKKKLHIVFYLYIYVV